MKIRQLFALIALAISGSQPLLAQLGCKAAEGYTKILERLPDEGIPFQNALAARAKTNPDVARAARFQDPDLPPEAVAFEKSCLGFGRAEDVAPDNLLGNNSATQWVELTNLKRVIDADSSITFDDIGSGIGQLAKRGTSNEGSPIRNMDSKIGKMIGRYKEIFDNDNLPYQKAGYSEARLFKDVDFVLKDDAFVQGLKGDPKAFSDSILSASLSGGIPLEVRAVARLKSEGKLLGVSLDRLPDGTKLYPGGDALSPGSVVSIKLGADTILFNLENSSKLLLIAEGVANAARDGYRYKFLIGRKVTDGQKKPLEDALTVLNNTVKKEHASILPPNYQPVTLADIILENSLNQ